MPMIDCSYEETVVAIKNKSKVVTNLPVPVFIISSLFYR